jgi:hypothetical protein
MHIEEAQAEMRHAYVGGGLGAIVSGLVWVVAAVVQQNQPIGTTFAVLFVGGMLIFPLSMLIERLLFARKQPSPTNSLGRIALESTIMMIAMLLLAWLLVPVRPDWVLPIAAIAIGTHYLPFRSAYGDVLYWVLGGLITLVGVLAIYRMMPPAIVAPAVAAIEIILGAILIWRERAAASPNA